ncbi:unnamed protein product, partial [Aphanomyces euteiches]
SVADQVTDADYVASLAGAWIEMAKELVTSKEAESHPLRVRGLKLAFDSIIDHVRWSHPLR